MLPILINVIAKRHKDESSYLIHLLEFNSYTFMPLTINHLLTSGDFFFVSNNLLFSLDECC